MVSGLREDGNGPSNAMKGGKSGVAEEGSGSDGKRCKRVEGEWNGKGDDKMSKWRGRGSVMT